MNKTDNDIKIRVSKNIKYLLDSEHKSRREVCNDLDIKYTTFCDWINGKTLPSYSALEKLASYFEVEVWGFYDDVNKARINRAKVLNAYANELGDGMVLEMDILDTLSDEQIKKLLAAGFRFRHRSLEELIEKTGLPLVSTPEYNWGAPVGREIW
ncbi:hypothetical protein SAMN02910298_02913 [Pseudobutyrivibrio sp. YE44]|uniref:hypothetical protein n=1 Tax=Pseudobutyrivibrio sp. YE44 TaxID=1520802 RepID=UPI0008907614|nr:hypothetical protein [Pseudobutyrivibrio sp. YE44]SDB56463.1 hypothetical protein SAMN02910298_02913 [Pseudobutyrivibrio sp. YE44]